MKRTVKKQFWFSKPEAQDLQKKAKKTCLSEAALVRLLVRGYEPKERPDENSMMLCASSPLSATISTSFPSRRMHSALLISKC